MKPESIDPRKSYVVKGTTYMEILRVLNELLKRLPPRLPPQGDKQKGGS